MVKLSEHWMVSVHFYLTVKGMHDIGRKTGNYHLPVSLGKKKSLFCSSSVFMFSYSHSMHKSFLFSGNQGTSSVSLWSMCLGFLLLPSIYLSKSEVPKLFLLDSHTWNLMEGHGQKANSYCIVLLICKMEIESQAPLIAWLPVQNHSTFHAQIMKNN